MKPVFISEEATDQIKDYLREQSLEAIEIKKTETVYQAIASHPDIYMCKIGEDMVVEENQYNLICHQLSQNLQRYHPGKSKLESQYPYTIPYNAVALGKYFVHSIAHSDERIKELVRDKGMTFINVKQGYTKCNLVEVDETSVITSDKGIAEALKDEDIDVLFISKGQVKLKGFEYGFLGGASGKIEDEIVFNGNLEEHKDFFAIKAFIEERKKKIKYFRNYPLEDIGSILTID